MSNEWYITPKETKVRAYNQVAEDIGMAAYAIEKDWWVVQSLSAILDMKIGEHFVFKGGTSLSKAWGLIERFSEDIDLALDRNFFGYSKELTRTQIKKLRKDTGKYIENIFTTDLNERFIEKGLGDVSLRYIEPEASDADPARIEIIYPNVIDYPGYIPTRVLLEISSSSIKEPNQVQDINSFLDDFYFESSFAEDPIKVPTAIPERTFLEKLFLLHEEFQRPHEKIRVERLSRHLYDVFQLIKTDHANDAINNPELYETLVKHRYAFFRVGSVDYNLHQPQTLNPIPIPEFIDEWAADYKTMQEQMIYGNSPSFDKMIKKIQGFTADKLNKVKWEINL